MADDAVTLGDINWREMFPFTHVFRAFRIAIHPSKLVIALVALGCLWCGGLVLDVIWPASHQVTAKERQALRTAQTTPAARGQEIETPVQTRVTGVFRTFFDYEVMQANNVLMFPFHVSLAQSAWYSVFESVWLFVAVGPLWLWSAHPLFALIYTAWFLLIWSVFGGAISRIAAVHVARDEKISVRHAVSFSAGKVLSFIFAPVIPVLIILGIGVIISISSTILLHIPYIGPGIAGLFFFLALVGGFIITLVILGTIGGFNLMYPTVAVEGSDSFDAISRSFSYVFARPWRMLWYTIVAVAYGAVCYLFVRFFVWLMLRATWFFMTWFLGGHGVNQPAAIWPLIWPAPSDPLASLRYTPEYEHLKGTEAFAAGLIVWWVYLVIGLIGAFAVSFYFSANTIIYYLMRREVDATDMDDVYVEETEDEPEDGEPTAGSAEATVTTTTTVVTTEPSPPAPQTGAEGTAPS